MLVAESTKVRVGAEAGWVDEGSAVEELGKKEAEATFIHLSQYTSLLSLMTSEVIRHSPGKCGRKPFSS
jgi:hypothetical protein